jgi:hypothetical protein
VDFFFIDEVGFSLRSRVAILSDTLETCQYFFKVFPKFSLKRFKPLMTRTSRMIQRSKISRQLLEILVFRGNVTILLPFGALYPQEKSAPPADRAKKLKEKMHDPAHLPVLENFWPTNLRMIRNDENDEARMTNDEGAVSSRWSCPCSGAIS